MGGLAVPVGDVHDQRDTGSFAIGLLTVLLSAVAAAPERAAFRGGWGSLGGYTTFSSFAAETLAHWERGERGLGISYVLGSVGAGLAAVVLGAAIGRGLTEAPERWSARDGRAASAAAPELPRQDGPARDRAGDRGAAP